MPPWTILFAEEVAQWLKDLDKASFKRVLSVVEALKSSGPQLGTPYVKPIVSSTHSNMKELRIVFGDQHFRILFAFDLKRRAIFLAAGDKSKIGWTEFYAEEIPLADERFAKHQRAVQAEIDKEKALKARSTTGKPRKKLK